MRVGFSGGMTILKATSSKSLKEISFGSTFPLEKRRKRNISEREQKWRERKIHTQEFLGKAAREGLSSWHQVKLNPRKEKEKKCEWEKYKEGERGRERKKER